MSLLKPGVRVVRGPNWTWGQQDGGEGFVGTVAQIGTSESDKTVVVQWDNGSRSICRIGYFDKYDLRVIDNAQVGVVHHRITCDACETTKITGLRYKCLSCHDYDLCYKCYHGDKHSVKHSFRRFETEKSKGITLPPRLFARSCTLRGIFERATVSRGYDWEWGNQDGGEGNYGIVQEIKGLNKKCDRSTAAVKWDKTNTEIYRVGLHGHSDVQFVEAATGGPYYPEHLPILGQNEEEMEFNGIIENIELQQVMEMERNAHEERSSEMEEPTAPVEEPNAPVEEPNAPMEEPNAPMNEPKQPNETEQKDSNIIKSVYASIVRRYVTCSLYPVYGGRPNLVDGFFRASRNSTDEAVRDMWEIIKYVTGASVRSDCACCDVIETRDKSLFIWESVQLGKKFLEKRYKDYMMSVINGQGNEGYGLQYVNVYDLVYDFVGLRFREEYVGLADEMLDNRPLWPMVYYCIRAGGFMAAAKCLTKLNVPGYETIVNLLELYARAPNTPEIDILEETIKASYKTCVRDASDPFQRMVWAVLGGVDDICEVARTVDDFLWFKLSLVRADRDNDNARYKYLQCQILEEQGEMYHDALKQPLVYFKLLALTGQFEAAIDFLFRMDKFKVEATHMAIALYEINLLACPEDTEAPLLSISPEDRRPARRLNIALLVKSYVNKLEVDNLEDTLHYLCLLRRIKNCEEGPNLFEVSVADLILRTKQYAKILGKVGKNGARDRGVLDRLDVDCQLFAEDLAQNLVRKEQYEEAIALYEDLNDQNGMLWVMCKVLAKVAHLDGYPGSLRDKFQEKAELFEKRFIKEGFCSAHINVVNSFMKLKGLLTFFDHYRTLEYFEALETLIGLRIVPLKFDDVEERVENFKNYVEDVGKVMPSVLLAAMTITGTRCKNVKYAEGPRAQRLQVIWENANCITNFAERLPGAVPEDTTSKLTQMEVRMHA